MLKCSKWRWLQTISYTNTLRWSTRVGTAKHRNGISCILICLTTGMTKVIIWSCKIDVYPWMPVHYLYFKPRAQLGVGKNQGTKLIRTISGTEKNQGPQLIKTIIGTQTNQGPKLITTINGDIYQSALKVKMTSYGPWNQSWPRHCPTSLLVLTVTRWG